MPNTEHLAILRAGVQDWNFWKKGHADIVPDLSGSDLSGADLGEADLDKTDLSGTSLVGADLSGARLSGADLRGSDLHQADLRRADLQRANLIRARLWWSDLKDANLAGAHLSEADLSAANLERANLRAVSLRGTDFAGAIVSDADFSDARTRNTSFANVDLTAARGLENVVHEGPSTIGIDTIIKSRGKIPEAFLRGCGVPDDIIGYIKSIAGAIQFYSCFISYSTKDQEFADRLYADLQNKGVRCWFAPHDIKGGRKIHEQLDEAIRLHDKLLLILSEASMNSDWVKTEILKARKREVEENKATHPSKAGLGGAPDGGPPKKQMLFPITLMPYDELREWECFDADTGTDAAREIREYFIPDFSNWKDHDSYQQAFQRLIKDLKADNTNRSAAG